MIVCTSPDQKLIVSKDWFSFRPIEIEPIQLKGPFFALDEATLKAIVQGYKENESDFRKSIPSIGEAGSIPVSRE